MEARGDLDALRQEELLSLERMEQTGGEPDLIGRDEETGEYLFCDCSAESPRGRRSLCYDRVFIYRNGAESHYGSRGFRGMLRV